MDEAERIADELTWAYRGAAWHGPALREVLDGVTAEDAAAHPIPGAHSIAELVPHLTTWAAAGRSAAAGEWWRPTDADDWPTPDVSETGWQAARQRLAEAHEQLVAAVRELDDERLDETGPGSDGSLYRILHGVAQHYAYHAGQIVLLRRALASRERVAN